jgi:DNA-binding transcriptional ArsR family regulator
MIPDNTITAMSKLFGLLSEPNRLRILFFLGKDEKSVSEIISKTGLTQPLVSFHLRILRENGLVTTERNGTFVYYRLSDPSLYDLLAALSGHTTGVVGISKEEQGVSPEWPPIRFMRSWFKEVK